MMVIRMVLILWAVVSGSAFAQSSTDGVLINADIMDRDLQRQTVTLKGNVQVVFQGQHLSCDRATLDLKNKQVIAEGNVVMHSERAHVEGQKVVFNYKQDTGFIYKGFVQSGQIVFEGDVIEKSSDQRYLASNAQFTACETCPPGWSFSGRTIDAEIGGYARIRRPVFRVAGVPVLLLPSIIVPLKSSRQSGLLVPSLEYSGRGGAALSESYFWAISRSQDLTLTPTYYEKLGVKAHGDYRYVLSEESRGRLQSAWIRDRQLPKEVDLISEDFDRWFATYHHYFNLPLGYVHRAKLNATSDLRYPRDFPEELKGHGDPALENKMSLSKATDNTVSSVEMSVYSNLLKTYPLANNDDSVHRTPEFRFSLKDQDILDSGFFFRADAQFVNFAREQFSYDDLQGTTKRIPLGVGNQGEIARDGRFDPDTDLVRTGQRFDLRPTLSYPFQIARKLDVVPSVSYRETQYRFYPTESALDSGFSPTAARRYAQTELQVRSEFSRVFGDLTKPDSTRYKHSIEPEVAYTHIPWIRRPNHPFFGEFEGLQYSRQFEPVSDADLNNPNTGIQFDYHDRTYNKQVVDFSVTNRLTKKTFRQTQSDYQTLALFRLSQSYDIDAARAKNPYPWSSVNGLLDMRFEHFTTYTTAAYNGYAKVTNVSTRARALLNPKNYLEARYTRNFILTDTFTVAPNGETRNVGWGAGFMTRPVEAQGGFEYDARTWQLQSFGYALVFRPPGNCWNIKFEHTLAVAAEPKFHLSASFDWGGENKNALF